MGNEFSEHVLFYTAMKKCFGRYGTIRLTGEEIKAMIGDSEPDYYLRNDADLFLFEFKDVVLSTDIKYSGDAAKIKAGIANKLERIRWEKEKESANCCIPLKQSAADYTGIKCRQCYLQRHRYIPDHCAYRHHAGKLWGKLFPE